MLHFNEILLCSVHGLAAEDERRNAQKRRRNQNQVEEDGSADVGPLHAAVVGEIRDEYDADEQDPVVPVSETEFLIDGTAKLEDVNEATGLLLASDDYDSIAGHIYQLLEHIPTEGETVTDENGVIYEVIAVDKNRIDRIRLTLPQIPSEVPTREMPE